MLLPTTPEEVRRLGWQQLDVILVTGDTYIDSPFIGAAVIGKVLLAAGFRVGIIAQPDTETGTDITRLGEPLLFWALPAGSGGSPWSPTGQRRGRDGAATVAPAGWTPRRPARTGRC